MNRQRVARELVKLARELVSAHNEKGLVAALESLGFADWSYSVIKRMRGIALSRRLDGTLIRKHEKKFPRLAKKYGYVYLPDLKSAFFAPKSEVSKAKRKTFVHREIEILAPLGGSDDGWPHDPWVVPAMGNAEFLSKNKAIDAIEEMYQQYLSDVEAEPEDEIDWQEWLAEWGG